MIPVLEKKSVSIDGRQPHEHLARVVVGPDRADRRFGPALGQTRQGRDPEGVQGRPARPVYHPEEPGQRGPSRIHQGVSRHVRTCPTKRVSAKASCLSYCSVTPSRGTLSTSAPGRVSAANRRYL